MGFKLQKERFEMTIFHWECLSRRNEDDCAPNYTQKNRSKSGQEGQMPVITTPKRHTMHIIYNHVALRTNH